MEALRIGFFASHGGSNMQAIVDACKTRKLDAEPTVLISNNSKSRAMERAQQEGIPCFHLSSVGYSDPEILDRVMLEVLETHKVNLIVLAGYMKKLGPETLSRYKGYILNIHPSLLPKHGGVGMYGDLVHEAVLNAKDKVTGITIHLVDENYDTGSVISQSEVLVLEGDTVETLGKRVLQREHEFFVETLIKIRSGEIKFSLFEKDKSEEHTDNY
ncbi:MAG: phosphoribosylglycinamide formyltransferase [Paenibacillaceae bacterium]